jgi:hypothetical protein
MALEYLGRPSVEAKQTRLCQYPERRVMNLLYLLAGETFDGLFY